MKIIPTSYTFNKTAKTVFCADFISIEKIALITNLTTGDIIYQFNSASKWWTLSGNTLTLDFDTSAMNDADILQIIIHDTTPLATEEKQEMLISLSEMTVLLKSILTSLQMPRNADPSNNADQVVVIGTVPVSLASLPTLANLTTLANLQQLNGEQAHLMSVASEINAWANAQRSTIS